MSEIKHTQGPWTVKKSSSHNGYCVSVAQDDHEISISVFAAYGAREKERQETALANANLVSAAPDMLKALRGLLNGEVEAIAWGEEAVAKAEGRNPD